MPRIVKDPGNDGRRNSRWDDHREARRAELVDAAVAAIDEHGPSASIAQIAASAGVSKPVLYRYFTDKDDLYRAVGAWGANAVIEGLLPVLLSDQPIRDRVEKGCDAYLALISRHPHVFFLLVEHPTNEDPLADGKEMVAATISRTLGRRPARPRCRLRRRGALGARPRRARALHRRVVAPSAHDEPRAVSAHLSSFIWHAFEGIAREHGVRIDSRGRLRLVEGRRTLMPSSTTDRRASATPRSRSTCVGSSSRSTGASTGGGASRPTRSCEAHTSGATVTLVTPHGAAQARLSDVDPWGRFRVSGTGKPPF